MLKRTSIALTILTLLLFPAAVWAQWGMGHHMSSRQSAVSDADIQAWQKHYNDYSQRIWPIMQKLQSSRLSLQAELLKEEIDEKAVDQLVGKINGLRSELFIEQVNYYKSLAKSGLAFDAMCSGGMGMGMDMSGGMMSGSGSNWGGMGPGMMPGYGPYHERSKRRQATEK